MNEIVLHHYASSPFSEKVRLVFGVTPSDYAHDEVVGSLVGLNADEIVVERVDPRAGTVHVHFPRVGFHVKALKKEIP